MRRYEAIWLQLKKTGECRIIAHPSLHARIKKAVTKEKHQDLEYRLSWGMQDAPQPELLRTTNPDNKNQIIFRLIKPITLGDL
jgi:hypothetical protein